MYEYISGLVAELTPTYAVLDAGGVGYHIHISLQTYAAIEGEKSADSMSIMWSGRTPSYSMALPLRLSVSSFASLSVALVSGVIRLV